MYTARMMQFKEWLTQHREWLTQHRSVVLAAVAVILAASVASIFYQTRASEDGAYHPTASWYYDLQNGKLFAGTENIIPPISRSPTSANSGGSISVGARLFSCGQCATETRFIGWLEKYTPEGKQRIEGFVDQAPREALDELAGNEKLIAAPPAEGASADRLQWHGWDTGAGRRIRQAVHERCEDGEAKECLPGDN